MVIKKIRLENFRGFEGVHEFELHSDHINVIIGANGAGKTSVLDAISYPFFKIFASDYQRRFIGKNFHGWDFTPDHKLDISFLKTQMEIEISLLDGNKNLDLNYFYLEDIKYPHKEAELQPKAFKFENNRIFKEYQNKRELNLNDHNQFPKWFKDQVTIQSNEKVKIAETSKKIESVLDYEIPSISLVNKAVKIFIQELTDNKFINITLDKSRYEDQLVLFIEKVNDERVEYKQLSSGEKAVFTMLLELAMDAYTYNSDLKNPLHAPGIVLVDEIELHLHPKWQTSILHALNKTFPNIQFIVTTHSPLVINHLKNENLILLDDFKITEGINVQSVYGRDVNSIITDFMGASARPKEVDDLINDIEVLLDEDQPDINLAKEKLSQLKNLTSPNHSEALKLETLITIEEED